MLPGTIEEKASRAEEILSKLSYDIVCVPQEWDDRVDCLLKLPDGTVIGEMIPLAVLTEERVLATGERLRRRAEGVSHLLVDEIRAPIRINPESQHPERSEE